MSVACLCKDSDGASHLTLFETQASSTTRSSTTQRPRPRPTTRTPTRRTSVPPLIMRFGVQL